MIDKSRLGSGIDVLAHLLHDILPKMDGSDKPLEKWARGDFDGLRRTLREEFKSWKVEASTQYHAAANWDRDTLQRRASVKHLKSIETQALEFLATLERRILHQKDDVRFSTLHFIREWLRA